MANGGQQSNSEQVQTQWLPPSSIHYLHILGQEDSDDCYWYCSDNSAYANCNSLSKIQSTDCSVLSSPLCLPKKLQVTEKDGTFIALDNNSLQLMRHLEKLGHCTEVEVEIVPLSKVPPNIITEILDSQKEKYRKECKSRYRKPRQGSKCLNGTNKCNRNLRGNFRCGSRPTKTTKSANTITSTTPPTMATITTTSVSISNGFCLNGANTYLSEQQLRTARMSNTMTVMAPCLRQPITTSTPASQLSLYHLKWNYCCNEQMRTRISNTNSTGNKLSKETVTDTKFGKWEAPLWVFQKKLVILFPVPKWIQ